MRIDLGELVPALREWILCINECGEECVACVELPAWASGLSDKEQTLIAMYLFARKIMDYRAVAAMHVYSARNKVAVSPDILMRCSKDSKVVSRVSKRVEGICPHAWEAVFWRGIAYADQVLDLDKPVVVKVIPPNEKREREKLRVLLEGKRVTVRGRTYHVGGIIKKVGGERLAPWTYLVPKRALSMLINELGEKRVIARTVSRQLVLKTST